jgi:hypothetical protein
MPLEIEVRRGKNNHAVKLTWDYLTLSAVLTSAMMEGDPDYEVNPETGLTFGDLEDNQIIDWSMAPIYYMDTDCPLWTQGHMTLQQDHTFTPTPERTISLRAGDRIHMWRSSSSK